MKRVAVFLLFGILIFAVASQSFEVATEQDETSFISDRFRQISNPRGSVIILPRPASPLPVYPRNPPNLKKEQVVIYDKRPDSTNSTIVRQNISKRNTTIIKPSPYRPRPQVIRPNVTKPNTTKPNVTKTNTTKSNVTITNTTKLNITKPNTTKPNVTITNTSKPNVTITNTTKSNITKPNTTKPNFTITNTTKSNITNPNITKPNATKFKITTHVTSNMNKSNNTKGKFEIQDFDLNTFIESLDQSDLELFGFSNIGKITDKVGQLARVFSDISKRFGGKYDVEDLVVKQSDLELFGLKDAAINAASIPNDYFNF